MRSFVGLVLAGFIAVLLTGCNNVQVSSTPVVTYTIGGTVTGLNAGATLSVVLNNTTTLSVSANGPFAFSLPVQTDVGYIVTVVTQPVGETCTVANYTAPSLTADIANVNIVCSANTFTIGGTVTGLSAGTQVSLEDNGGDSTVVTANGAFTFPTSVAYNGSYNVTVGTNPVGETCSVSGGTGSGVIANVTGVSVVCSVNTFMVGGTVTGLGSGNSVTLTDNGGDPVMVGADGAYVFSQSVAYNGGYNVMVMTQPVGQTCSVSNATGLATATNITNVNVMCSVNTYPVSGTVTGLGSGVQVTLTNGSDATIVTADGAFNFTTQVPYGGSYDVMVGTNPIGQTCTVMHGMGSAVTAPVTNVAVMCAVDTFTVGGNVTGAVSAGLVLQNNGTDNLAVAANSTSFQFATPVAYGSGYNVLAVQSPVDYSCGVTNGNGANVMANVTTVGVNCSLNQFTVGGTVSGLTGTVVLQDNNGNSTTINSNGSFTFSSPVAEGSGYNVTVYTQPANQSCTVMNGSSINISANVTNVSVNCATNSYTVGGTLTGAIGSVVLQNSNGDSLVLYSNGPFTLSTPVAEGSSYNVTVFSSPTGQNCSVVNGSGTMGGANVTNVSVNCVTPLTTISASVSDMALSVTGLTEYGVSGTPSSGFTRYIKITNTGPNEVIGLSVSLPTFPTGTIVVNDCASGTLGPGISCEMTIDPGSVATSDGTNPCSAGTAPVPGVISVSGSNVAVAVTTNVVVLSYGCIYQGGYVFALDDTTSAFGSVGGKVAATFDQAAPLPSGIIWSSNGNSGTSADVVLDSIYGISEVSTASSPDPGSGQVTGQRACNGSTDGNCNTNNIYTYYQNDAANSPISTNDYAAGLCKQTIATYSDWYLPSVCEEGYSLSACGTQSAPTVQNMQSGLVDFNSLHLLDGIYFSSSETSSFPQSEAWATFFQSGVGNSTDTVAKSTQAGARCVRSLTQ